MSEAITIRLSDPVYKQLKRAAELSHQPMEAIVEQSLAHSLPPLLNDIPAEYQADVFPLLQMDRTELDEEAQRVFPADRWARYEGLLEKKASAGLTVEDERRLAELRHEADVLMLRKRKGAWFKNPES